MDKSLPKGRRLITTLKAVIMSSLRKGYEPTNPSHQDVLAAILEKYTKMTNGTTCIDSDLDMDKVECWAASSFVPSIAASTGTVSTYSSQNLEAGMSITLPFTVSGMTPGSCSICPNPKIAYNCAYTQLFPQLSTDVDRCVLCSRRSQLRSLCKKSAFDIIRLDNNKLGDA